MQFTLTGFKQDNGCRVFEYEGVGADRVRVKYSVRADLALSRKYGIRLQELPLMCLEILERNSEPAAIEGTEATPIQHHVTFTEEAMIRYADECVATHEAAIAKRASMRRAQPAKESPTEVFNPYGNAAPVPVKPFGQNW